MERGGGKGRREGEEGRGGGKGRREGEEGRGGGKGRREGEERRGGGEVNLSWPWLLVLQLVVCRLQLH